MNNMYWDLIRSRDNNLLWYNLVKKFRNKFSQPLIHIVAFLYKIYLIKISQLKKNNILPITTPKQEPITTPKQEPITPPKQEPITPPKQEPTRPTKQEPTKPTKQEPTKPTKQEPTIEPEQEVRKIKKTFSGALRHTPGSNYKEWKKEMCNWTQERVDNKTFSEWKKQDKFDPKKYDASCPWYKYIDLHMN